MSDDFLGPLWKLRVSDLTATQALGRDKIPLSHPMDLRIPVMASLQGSASSSIQATGPATRRLCSKGAHSSWKVIRGRFAVFWYLTVVILFSPPTVELPWIPLDHFVRLDL